MPGMSAKTAAPKGAAPAAPPVERASPFSATATPSRSRPATVWMVTWIVGMTQPKPRPHRKPSAMTSAMWSGSTPRRKSALAAALKPITGIQRGRPVRRRIWAEVTAAVTMPPVTGNSKSPAYCALTRWPSCR